MQDKPVSHLVPFAAHGIAPYMRVSSKAQILTSQVLKLQTRVYGPNRWKWPTEPEFIFQEKESAFRGDGLSKREELKRLLSLARQGKLRGMAVTRINRFCRNTKTALIIYDEFHGLGFKFIEAENPEVDYFTVEHKAAFLRKAAEAEAWSLDHANRVRDGKASVHHDGRTNAPKPTFGASRIKNGVPKWTLRAMIPLEAIEHYSKAVHSIRETADHLSVYKAQAETIYDLWREGKTNEEIAAAVGKPLRVVKVYVRYRIERAKIESAHLAEPMIFTNPQVQRWLNCPTYYGLVRHTPAPLGRRLATGAQIRRSRVKAAKFKGIVKRAVWYVIQALLSERHHAGRGASQKATTSSPRYNPHQVLNPGSSGQ